MNVKLSPDEYRKLIELAYLGEWLINAHHDTEYQDDEAGQALQALMANGPIDGIEQDVETNEYYLQDDWVQKLYDAYILDYDDHVFWDELAERLAQRDLAKQRGVAIEEINRDDDLLELRPLEDRYREELEENGIERLDIQNGY